MSNQKINLINNIVNNAEKKGIARLKLENIDFDGKKVLHEGKSLISFGGYSYLGLSVDRRLKNAAIDAINKFGIQYPSSRVYSSLPLYSVLLKQFKEIFGTDVVLTTSLSLGHLGVMPILIDKKDILLLDQYVHSSVQDAAEKLKVKGTKISVIRHNDLTALENKIIEYSNKYDKVWYAIDGIYSMYGDTAPILAIEELMNKYPKFYVYADDAHGVSSYGKNGSGWILSKIKLHEKLVLTTGMAKAFGTMGGVFVTKNADFHEKINNCTGSLIFSGPHPIAILGASIESAKIHLSNEIYIKQNLLKEKIAFCHNLLISEGVPEISSKETPIFFIPVGKLKAGYLLVTKMKMDGFLTNLASFPAVSESCTGIRFSISLHHTFSEIEKLVTTFKKNYFAVLEECEISFDFLKRAFKSVNDLSRFNVDIQVDIQVDNSLKVKHYKSINQMTLNEQSKLVSIDNLFSVDFFKTFEKNGEMSDLLEEQYSIDYFSVYDKGVLLVSTFFTTFLAKDDMLAEKNQSRSIEDIRVHDKYYLTSKTMVQGTPLTEGTHIYLKKNHELIFKAMRLLISEIDCLADQNDVNAILFRDFNLGNEKEKKFFTEEGFLELNLPDNHEIYFGIDSLDNFIQNLSKKRRKYIRDKVFSPKPEFSFSVNENPTYNEGSEFYKIYKSVVDRSLELNTFPLNRDLIIALMKLESWKLLEIKNGSKLVAGMLVCEKQFHIYAVLIGMDYSFLEKNIYPKILWETVKYGSSSEKLIIKLGSTASQNKRKFGAKVIYQTCYYKSKDNLNQLISQWENQKTLIV